jgi:signal peptidase I
VGLFNRTKRPKRSKSPLANGVELVATVAVVVGIAFLLEALVAKPYEIPSLSMYPTLSVGQRIVVNRLDTSPGLGDIVVFHPPAGENNAYHPTCANRDQGPQNGQGGHGQACDQGVSAESTNTLIKRVVGLPGDHLRIVDGYVYNDGHKETGSYINVSNCPGVADDQECTLPKQITVPAGEYYMMGDNRGDSDDSRYWGPVQQRNIIGVAFLTYWPLDRIGFF